MVSKPRCWTIRALCRGGRCRGTVLIEGTGRSRKLYAESGSCSARATRLGRASMPKRKRRSPASSQRSRCSVWVKSVSPRTKNERKPAWRQRRTARSMKLAASSCEGRCRCDDQVQRLLVWPARPAGMIAPGAVVGDIDALFALGVGADEVPSTSMIAWSKSRQVAGPDALAGAVDGIHEIQDVTPAEPATEVARGGGVGDSLCIQA